MIPQTRSVLWDMAALSAVPAAGRERIVPKRGMIAAMRLLYHARSGNGSAQTLSGPILPGIVGIAQTFVKSFRFLSDFLAFLCIVFRKNSQYNGMLSQLIR